MLLAVEEPMAVRHRQAHGLRFRTTSSRVFHGLSVHRRYIESPPVLGPRLRGCPDLLGQKCPAPTLAQKKKAISKTRGNP